MLIGTQRRARARDITVWLGAPRPQMTQLPRILTIRATLSGALAAQ
jgi:hypothetical protein